ncbi:MAG: hypothetical protein JOZ01_08500 [Candidatus Eremiobacteraeota bacterium]|nr:hypothetical protein [Candidatus Eremiobacteraeota bacterium]
MPSPIPAAAFNQFFAWAPLIVGLLIYLTFYVAKRHEVTEHGVPIGQTFACANCGRRGHREHMVPHEHAGAMSWYCARCAVLGASRA